MPLPSLFRSRSLCLLLGCALPSLAGCGGGELAGSGDYDVLRYDLAGEYDWARGRLVASVGITLTTTAPSVGAVTLDSSVTEVKAVRAATGGELAFAVDGEEGTLTVDVSSLGSAKEGAVVAFVVDYEVAPGDSLRAIAPRIGDPVAVRAVLTDSEPERASQWMPCHDRPDDRAMVSFDMKMADDEKMIANGELLVDDAGDSEGGRHRMKYETHYPLPTYQMAFAISDFEVEEEAGGTAGSVPVAVWHRRGVAGDYPGTVAELRRLMEMFPPLLGPYPFERYSVVMVPEFSGGMENAGITFQSETSTAQPALSASLIAHEFGHQWFGDAVTVATWDDLWIKEGMATLLATEAARPFEDRSQSGVLFGDRFYVVDGEAARDRALAPADKYTSGPYDRAAWIWTQLRSVVGEEVFWATMRGIVEEHLYSTVSSDEVLAAFAPHLSPAGAAAAARAVDARAMPELAVEPGTADGARLQMNDPKGILIAPLELEWHREDGTVERQSLVSGQAVELARAAEGDFLVVDPDDVHPDLWRWEANADSRSSYRSALVPLLVPATPGVSAGFAEVAGIHQFAALSWGRAPRLAPEEYDVFVSSLNADSARASSVAAVYDQVNAWDEQVIYQAWLETLTAAVSAEPVWRGLPYALRAGDVGQIVPVDKLFAPAWAALSAGLETPSLTVEEVYYLSTFDLPPADARSVWVPAAKMAYSVRIRSLAARQVRLRRYLFPAFDDTPPDLEEAPWRAAILDLLASSDASEVLQQLIPAAKYFPDGTDQDRRAFTDRMTRILWLPSARLAHASALCWTYWLLQDQPAEWNGFTAGLIQAPLSALARERLVRPAACLD